MRKALALFSATALLLATASTAVAAKPDDVWRYAETGSYLDEHWTASCGFDVTQTFRLQFSAQRLNSLIQVERVYTGPGGTATLRASLDFRYPNGFETIEDPDAGTTTEIYREVARGSFIWTTPQDGVIYRDAGYAAVTWTIVYSEEGETMDFGDEVYHGQMPAGDEDVVALVCEALA